MASTSVRGGGRPSAILARAAQPPASLRGPAARRSGLPWSDRPYGSTGKPDQGPLFSRDHRNPRRRVTHLPHDVAFGRRQPCGGFRTTLYCTNGADPDGNTWIVQERGFTRMASTTSRRI